MTKFELGNARHDLHAVAHSMPRRIVTDGRWIDPDHDGRYNVLEIEATGMPFHEDNETVLKERIFRQGQFV